MGGRPTPSQRCSAAALLSSAKRGATGDRTWYCTAIQVVVGRERIASNRSFESLQLTGTGGWHRWRVRGDSRQLLTYTFLVVVEM